MNTGASRPLHTLHHHGSWSTGGFLVCDCGQGDSLLRAGLREELSELVRLTLLASLLHKTRRGRVQEIVIFVFMTKLLSVDVRDRVRQPQKLAQTCVKSGVQVRLRWLHLEWTP